MIGYPTQVPMDGLSDQYFQYFLWIDGTIDSDRGLLLASLLALALLLQCTGQSIQAIWVP